MGLLERAAIAMGFKPKPPPDPEKARVLQRLDRLEGRVKIVEEWQRVEDALRGRAT